MANDTEGCAMFGAYTLVRIERTNHPSWGTTEHAECKSRLDRWAWPRAH